VRDHPMPSSLSRFLSGEASPAETRSLVKHLLRGCRRCLSVLAPMTPPLRFLAEAEPAEEGLSVDSYDNAIQSAIDAVRLHGTNAPKIKAATRKVHQRLVERGLLSISLKRYPDYAVFNALLQRIHELRNEDPQQMLAYASVAVHTARQMTEYPDAEQADLHVRALTECANALRVCDQLHEAGQQLDLAEQWYAASTQDPLLGLRLKDIRASLYGDQQHYEAASELLEEVYQGRLKCGNPSGAARALVGKGIFTAYAGQLEQAFQIFDQALDFADHELDSELRATVLHNKILFMVDAGRSEEALRLLEQNSPLLIGRVVEVKLLAIKARIYVSLGAFELAEAVLREVRQECFKVGLRAHEALAALDLAAVVLRQRQDRYSEAMILAMDSLKIFSKLQIQPQVEEALNVLMDAIQQDLVTATLLQSVTDFVRLAHHDRRARYQPRFE
jgi:tetratricopeptide (TPR) repeat protein